MAGTGGWMGSERNRASSRQVRGLVPGVFALPMRQASAAQIGQLQSAFDEFNDESQSSQPRGELRRQGGLDRAIRIQSFQPTQFFRTEILVHAQLTSARRRDGSHFRRT